MADGAWCWFADPGAVYRDGRTYVGFVTSAGDVRVGALDDGTGAWAEVVLHPALEVDDHASPALLLAPDGRLHAELPEDVSEDGDKIEERIAGVEAR